MKALIRIEYKWGPSSASISAAGMALGMSLLMGVSMYLCDSLQLSAVCGKALGRHHISIYNNS